MSKNSTLWAAFAVLGVFAGGCTVTVDNNPDASVWDTGGSPNVGTGGSTTVGAQGGSSVGTGGTTTTVDTDSGAVGTGGTANVAQDAATTGAWAFSDTCKTCLNSHAGSAMTGCQSDAVCNPAMYTFSTCVKTQTVEACAEPFGTYPQDAAVSDYSSDITIAYASDCELDCAQGDGG